MTERTKTKATANTVKVPGATLYYEVRGTGPALVAIPGGPTDAGMLTALADQLADRYTVVTYEPRGHSRSVLDGAPEDVSVELHADDAARLIDAVGGEPAYVLGSSGGGTIGLALITRHAEKVKKLVATSRPSWRCSRTARGGRASSPTSTKHTARRARFRRWGSSVLRSKKAARSTASSSRARPAPRTPR